MRKVRVRLAVIAGAMAVLAALGYARQGPLSAAASQTSRAQLSLAAALDRYAAGAHAEAVSAASINRDIVTLLAEADAWLGPDAPPARRRVAAMFMLDLIWSHSRERLETFSLSGSSPDVPGQQRYRRPWPPRLPDIGVALPAVAWGCQLMSSLPDSSPVDRWWWLLSIALLEDAAEWGALEGRRAWKPPSVIGGATTLREAHEGHLAHAHRQLPDEPRVTLSGMTGRAMQILAPYTWTIGPRVRGEIPMFGREDVLRHREELARTINRGTLDDLERDFLKVAASPSLAKGDFARMPITAEALLHAGYLRMMRRDFPRALAHFDRAADETADRELHAILDYFRGWSYERLDRTDNAIAAYARAHATAPAVQNLSSLLATQLFLAGRREEGYAILDASWKRPEPLPSDLLDLFLRGGARLGGAYVERMRAAMEVVR